MLRRFPRECSLANALWPRNQPRVMHPIRGKRRTKLSHGGGVTNQLRGMARMRQTLGGIRLWQEIIILHSRASTIRAISCAIASGA